MVNNKQKEIMELRKMYLVTVEKFETKIFYCWTALFLSLVFLFFKNKISGWWILPTALITQVLDLVNDCRRKKNYNKLIGEIESGKVSKIE